MQPLKCGNGLVISSYTLLGALNNVSKGGPWHILNMCAIKKLEKWLCKAELFEDVVRSTIAYLYLIWFSSCYRMAEKLGVYIDK